MRFENCKFVALLPLYTGKKVGLFCMKKTCTATEAIRDLRPPRCMALMDSLLREQYTAESLGRTPLPPPFAL